MSKTKKTLLSDDHATALADLFRLLGDPTRLRIVVSCPVSYTHLTLPTNREV